MPSQKRVEELEAKIAFLQEKSKKVNEELREEKEAHKKAPDKLNLSLAFNQKLETYVGHTGDVVNKAKLFDANLAENPVTAGKVILVLVDFAEKMEELLDEMRTGLPGRRTSDVLQKEGTSSRRRGRPLKSGLRQLYPGVKARASSGWRRYSVSVLRMAVPTGGSVPARPRRRPLAVRPAVGIADCLADGCVSRAAVRQLDRMPDGGGYP